MTASEFIDNSHRFCHIFPALLVCTDKEEEESWPVQDFTLEVLLANKFFSINATKVHYTHKHTNIDKIMKIKMIKNIQTSTNTW